MKETCGECTYCIPIGNLSIGSSYDGRNINTCLKYPPEAHRYRKYWLTNSPRPSYCPFYSKMTEEQLLFEQLEPMCGVNNEML